MSGTPLSAPGRFCYTVPVEVDTVLQAVTLNEIEKIFGILERLGISREAVVIPLRPATPGSVRRLPGGKFEIVVDAGVSLDDWLPVLEQQLKAQLT